jgi:hypothetical protein
MPFLTVAGADFVTANYAAGKWELWIAQLDRASVAAKQARLWPDELPEPTA